MVGKKTLEVEDYLRILRKRWLPVVGLTILGGAAAYGVSMRLPKRFVSQTTILVQQSTVTDGIVRPIVTQSVNERLAAIQQQILSRARLEPIIDQFGLYHPESGKTEVASKEELVAKLQRAISVSPVQAMAGTGGQLPGFSVTVTYDDPHLAQQLCGTISSLFMENNLKVREAFVDHTNQFIDGQLDKAKASLDEQDSKLADFKRHYIGSLPDQEGMNFNILMGLNAQFESVTQALSQTQQDKAFAEASLAQQLADWKTAPVTARDPETMEQQLSAMQDQLAGLELKYTESHPDVIRMKSNIATLEKRIADAQSAKPAGAAEVAVAKEVEPAHILQLRAQIRQLDQILKQRTAQEDELQNQIGVYQSRVQSSPAIEQEYKEVTRDYQTALDFYNDLLRKQANSAMATDLDRQQQGEQFTVLDPANLPDQPAFPNQPAFAVGGTLGGLALGLGLAVFVEIQDTSMRSERDIEAVLHMPVLAMVPVVSVEGGKKKKLPPVGSTGATRLRA